MNVEWRDNKQDHAANALSFSFIRHCSSTRQEGTRTFCHVLKRRRAFMYVVLYNTSQLVRLLSAVSTACRSQSTLYL